MSLLAQKNQFYITDNATDTVRSFDANFKSKYQGKDFSYAFDKDAESESFWNAFNRWLEQLFKDWFDYKTPKAAKNAVSLFIKIMYVLIVFVVLFFVIRALVKKEGGLFFAKSNKKLFFTDGQSDSNLMESNLDQLISEAIKEHDYSLAIRYYYLKALKMLDQKSLIRWEEEKTNQDFQNQLPTGAIKNQFKYLSYLYSYCWYGKFQVDELQFVEVEKAFNSLNQLVSN